MEPKSHVTRRSIHSLVYLSDCARPDAIHSKKKLIKSFLIENPGLSRDSLRILIKDRKVLVHRYKNHFYVCWCNKNA